MTVGDCFSGIGGFSLSAERRGMTPLWQIEKDPFCRRVLAKQGIFLYTDLLPVQRWPEVRMLIESLGLRAEHDRDITANVLASCDDVAENRTKAFGGSSEMIDNFLAVPGSAVYEQMRSGAWEYRILRARRIR